MNTIRDYCGLFRFDTSRLTPIFTALPPEQSYDGPRVCEDILQDVGKGIISNH